LTVEAIQHMNPPDAFTVEFAETNIVECVTLPQAKNDFAI